MIKVKVNWVSQAVSREQGHIQLVWQYLQLFLTVCVFFLRESDAIPWISTRTKESRALPLLEMGRLDPLITCGGTHRDAFVMVTMRRSLRSGKNSTYKREEKTGEPVRVEKSGGEGCNYTSLERGRLICSPLTLSRPLPRIWSKTNLHALIATCPAWHWWSFTVSGPKLQCVSSYATKPPVLCSFTVTVVQL